LLRCTFFSPRAYDELMRYDYDAVNNVAIVLFLKADAITHGTNVYTGHF
jgi:hypothetical protein